MSECEQSEDKLSTGVRLLAPGCTGPPQSIINQSTVAADLLFLSRGDSLPPPSPQSNDLLFMFIQAAARTKTWLSV